MIEFAGADGTRLAATLTLPPGPGDFPAVVAVHAASGGTRAAPLLEHLASFLPSLGVATFIYDRRGEGASGGSPGARLAVLAADAWAAVSVTAEQPGVRPHCIGLWGHSQGGWIAPMAAAGNDMVAFLIVVAASGVTPHDQMIYATANLMREAGYAEGQIARATGLRNRLHELARGPGSVTEAEQLIREASTEPWYALTYLPDPASGNKESALEDEAAFEWDLDVASALAQLRIPVLLFHGETDRWVPIEESIQVWRTALDQHGARLTLARLPGCGHFPTLAADPSDPDEAGPISPAYEQLLADWLRPICMIGGQP
jgi:dipeptidyl aminopeptidase/acylaminoacyl peptidase